MINKKGFTLIELLAVIALIALISMVAIPNIVGLSTGIKKDQMIDDAKKLISLAKYKVNKSYDIRNMSKQPECTVGESCTFTFSYLNENGDIKTDPDGGNYNVTASKVTYSNKSGKAKYCVYLVGSKRKVCKIADGCNPDTKDCPCIYCVPEENLYSRSNVSDIVVDTD